MRLFTAAASAALLTVIVAGCSSSPSPTEHQHTGLDVVASTDVWGSVAGAVVGAHGTVKSLVTGTVADPHSFEASPADAAEVADAALVVYNGGHYDHWIEEVLSTNPDVPTVDGFSLLPTGEPANEHVFYDLATVKAVATAVAEKLGGIDAEHAADYTANAERFGAELDTLATAQRAIGAAHPGAAVVSTEPVAFYALRNSGITDRTPQSFADAVEEGDDPAPADVAAMLDLINSGQVSAIVVNTQTETPATQRISDAARQAGLPAIEVTETLPAGMDYLAWQRATTDEISARLDGAPAHSR